MAMFVDAFGHTLSYPFPDSYGDAILHKVHEEYTKDAGMYERVYLCEEHGWCCNTDLRDYSGKNESIEVSTRSMVGSMDIKSKVITGQEANTENGMDLSRLNCLQSSLVNREKNFAPTNERLSEISPPNLSMTEDIIPFAFGVFEATGARKYMEDRHVVARVSSPHVNILGYYAVHDGHVGSHCADYMANVCHLELEARLRDLNKVLSESEMIQLLVITFQALDHCFLNFARLNSWFDGCTTVVVFIYNGSLYCANVGDSRAVLSRSKRPLDLSTDHKPIRPSEHQRVRLNGGVVRASVTMVDCCCFTFEQEYGPLRIFPGGIAVSRAFGDLNLKDPCLGVCSSTSFFVSAPEISVTPLLPSDEFIILASDGLWDVFTSENAVDFVQDGLTSKQELRSIARDLCQAAKSYGSGDNITVIIVLLRNVS